MVLCFMQTGIFIEDNGLMAKNKEEVYRSIKNITFNMKENGKMISLMVMEN